MINIKSLTEEDKGRWVVYKDGPEYGRIKSWNDSFINVVYHCHNNWDQYEKYTAQATFPDDIEFTEEPKYE